jgi:hypothetical protein
MAKSETLTKKVTYKRAVYLQGKGTLQSQLKAAIDAASTVGSRKQIVNAGENTFILLNSVRSKLNMLFGSLLLFSRGRNQPLVTEDDAANELTVEQIAPPADKSGARRDFVESLLFFGIKGNHVVVLQSSGLRARQFETHLNWLLETKTNVMGDDDRVELADHPTQHAIKAILQSPVKSVSIGVPLETKPTTKATSRTETRHMAFKPDGAGFDILAQLLPADWFKKMKLGDSLDASRLKVEVHLSYSRTTDEPGQQLLNDIAIQLRNQEPEDVQIDLKNGAKLKGEELKVSGQISVKAYGGLVDPEDLFPRMRDWLHKQFEDGVIDA